MIGRCTNHKVYEYIQQMDKREEDKKAPSRSVSRRYRYRYRSQWRGEKGEEAIVGTGIKQITQEDGIAALLLNIKVQHYTAALSMVTALRTAALVTQTPRYTRARARAMATVTATSKY